MGVAVVVVAVVVDVSGRVCNRCGDDGVGVYWTTLAW
jgi:hypothetical protein